MNSTIAINLFLSFSGLLWGNPTGGCYDPSDLSDETCVGGLSSVASVMRHSRLPGGALYIPMLDRTSQFVQMHPSLWGVNQIIAHKHFGWNAYFASPSSFSSTSLSNRDFSKLMTPDFVPVMTNLDLTPMSPWSGYLQRIYFDHSTGTATIHIVGETQPNTAPAVESLVASLDHVANLNEFYGYLQPVKLRYSNSGILDNDEESGQCLNASRYWSPVVLFNDYDKYQYDACIQAALAHPYPPLVFYDSQGFDDKYYTPKIVNNNTVVFSSSDLKDVVSHLHVDINNYDKTIAKLNYSQTKLDNLPTAFMDADYIQDRKYLRQLADEAMDNNRIVGMSGHVPFTREGTWRMCMGGECPIGNIFTDAMRWASDADFAVSSSGGLRGPGWEAGPVHVGDIWDALPFSNFICTGVMSGVSVYRLLKYSTSVATFESTYTAMGDRLLQMSGMRMTYNTLVNDTESGRLVSVDIFDKETQQYLPLERLKLYRFATTNWMCTEFAPYPDLFGNDLRMEGEVPGMVDPSRNVQSIVGEYFISLNGTYYDTSIRGSHINDTEAFNPMNFIQTAESCLLDYYWDEAFATCVPCPAGKFVTFSDEIISFLITEESVDSAGRNLLSNRELFDVTIAPRYVPSFITFPNLTNNALIGGSTVLQPGESVAVSFTVDTSKLSEGVTRSTLSYGVVVDGGFPGCLTDLDIAFDVMVEFRAEEDLNQIDKLRPVGLSFMAIAMLLSMIFALWTYKHRNHRVVRASQPRFLLLVCLGIFIMASSIIPLSIDDSVTPPKGCSVACMAFPWLVSIGFAVTFSSLVAKIWRLNTIMNAAEAYQRVEVKEKEVLRPVICFVTVHFVLLLCWTLIDPLKWQREQIKENAPSSTYGFCKAEGWASIVFLILLILLDLLAMVVLCIQAYRARQMQDELTESRWLGVACASWIQVFLIGIPVILLTRYDPVASYFTQTAIIFLVCCSMLLLIFLPKISVMKATRLDSPSTFNHRASTRRGSVTTTHVSTGSTRTMIETLLRARIQELEMSLEDLTSSKSQPAKDIKENSLKETSIDCEDGDKYAWDPVKASHP